MKTTGWIFTGPRRDGLLTANRSGGTPLAFTIYRSSFIVYTFIPPPPPFIIRLSKNSVFYSTGGIYRVAGGVSTASGNFFAAISYMISEEKPRGRFETLQVMTRRGARPSACIKANGFGQKFQSVWGLFRNRRRGRRGPRRHIPAYGGMNNFSRRTL
jgi:hypothetical protein